MSAASVERGRERAGEVVADEHHFGAMDFGAGDLGERRAGRHDDRRRDAEPVGVVGEALRVVSGGRRHDAAWRGRVREGEQEVERAPLLERGRELQVLELQPDAGAGDLRQRL